MFSGDGLGSIVKYSRPLSSFRTSFFCFNVYFPLLQIPLVGNDGKVGLGMPGAVAPPQAPPRKKHSKFGAGTLRLAARSKLLQPPAKAFQNPLGDDDENDE